METFILLLTLLVNAGLLIVMLIAPGSVRQMVGDIIAEREDKSAQIISRAVEAAVLSARAEVLAIVQGLIKPVEETKAVEIISAQMYQEADYYGQPAASEPEITPEQHSPAPKIRPTGKGKGKKTG